jgi:mRNA interferase RelE/StbE
MPEYAVILSRSARKQLDKLTDKQVTPLLNAIQNLQKNPRPSGHRKLKGRPGYRIRVGDYRIIYSIEDKELIIEVIAIGQRGGIYD